MSASSGFVPFTKQRTLVPRTSVEPDDDAAAVSQLWKEYKETNARDARDKLIVQYSPLVKYVAGRVSVGLPQNIEQADLVRGRAKRDEIFAEETHAQRRSITRGELG